MARKGTQDGRREERMREDQRRTGDGHGGATSLNRKRIGRKANAIC